MGGGSCQFTSRYDESGGKIRICFLWFVDERIELFLQRNHLFISQTIDCCRKCHQLPANAVWIELFVLQMKQSVRTACQEDRKSLKMGKTCKYHRSLQALWFFLFADVRIDQAPCLPIIPPVSRLSSRSEVACLRGDIQHQNTESTCETFISDSRTGESWSICVFLF